MQHEQTISSQPLSHSRLINSSPVFYGWVIMVVGSLGLVMTSPGQTYAISIFIEHFIEDLGISRSLVSTLYSIGAMIAGFTMPYIGRQIDRRGSRFVMVAITAIGGVVCILMGFVNGVLALGLGFLALRIFGHGGLMLVSGNVINQWWVRRRGMIMGISGVLMSILGLATFPNLINWLIPIYGWRITFMIMGLMLLFLMTPLALIFVRNRPEDYGLQPDGINVEEKSGTGTDASSDEENWTVSEVIRTVTFWIVGLGTMSMAMSSTGLFFHMVSIFDDNGLSTTIAATVFIPIAVTTAVVTLSSGVLLDHFPARKLLALALVMQGITLAMAPYLYTVELAFAYGVMLGATFGLSGTVGRVIWANYYGRQHLGSITGLTTTLMVVGASLGPMPFGIGRDLLGSYNLVLVAAAMLPFFLSVLIFFSREPRKQLVA